MCRKSQGNIGEAVKQEENLWNEVRLLTYLVDRVSVGEGCEAAVHCQNKISVG